MSQNLCQPVCKFLSSLFCLRFSICLASLEFSFVFSTIIHNFSTIMLNTFQNLMETKNYLRRTKSALASSTGKVDRFMCLTQFKQL